MSIKFESAKAKLEFAQSTGTTAVLEAEEAAALYGIIETMHIFDMAEIAQNQTTIKTDMVICSTCLGAGLCGSHNANGIKSTTDCGVCNGIGFIKVE